MRTICRLSSANNASGIMAWFWSFSSVLYGFLLSAASTKDGIADDIAIIRQKPQDAFMNCLRSIKMNNLYLRLRMYCLADKAVHSAPGLLPAMDFDRLYAGGERLL